MVWILMGLMVIFLPRLCPGILQMPGASPEIDQELDPFDHPQSTILGIQESMKPRRLTPND